MANRSPSRYIPDRGSLRAPFAVPGRTFRQARRLTSTTADSRVHSHSRLHEQRTRTIPHPYRDGLIGPNAATCRIIVAAMFITITACRAPRASGSNPRPLPSPPHRPRVVFGTLADSRCEVIMASSSLTPKAFSWSEHSRCGRNRPHARKGSRRPRGFHR
jgi:hypothetical protein